MSTSIIYHMFGAQGYEYKRLLLEPGKIGFLVEKQQLDRQCPICGSQEVILKGFVERWLKTLPQGPYRGVYLVVKVRRFHCRTCGSRHQEPIDVISSPKLHYTKHLERFVEDLLEFATIQDVARHCQMSWNTVKAIDKRRLHRRKPKWKYAELEYIGFDEIYLGAKAKYRTIVYDLTTGRILTTFPGRGGPRVEKFMKKLRTFAGNLKAMAMDLAKAYWGKARALLPHVAVVFDRFHVVKLMNEKVDQVRRNLQKTCREEERKVLKGKRYLLLKNPENLTGNQAERLQELLDLNAPLATTYLLKEELRRLWDQPDRSTGQAFLEAWCAKALATDLKPLKQMAKTLRQHAWGILNYFDYPVTSGLVEGLNNKIKVMLRKQYGLRDQEYLELKLLTVQSARLALIG